MVAPTPFPFPDATVNSSVSLFQFANTLTAGLLGPSLVFIIWFLVFMSINDMPIKRAFVASVLAMFSATLLFVVGLVASWVVILSTIAVVATFFWMWRLTRY